MRGKACVVSFVGILSFSLLLTGFFAGPAFCGPPENKGGWIQDHIMDVQDIEMYEPFSDLFGQRELGRPVDYTYEETVKLVGHSCGATASAWEITKKALEVLYPDGEIPVRGNIKVYAPGAEDEWNIGVIGDVITYITGAAPATGFSGAWFGNGAGPYPGDPVYKRRNKMLYTDDCVGTFPPNGMIWTFERIDTDPPAKVCLRFKFVDFPPLGDIGIQPPTDANWKLLGAKVASGDATPEEEELHTTWWNDRIVDVFNRSDELVVVLPGCPPWPPPEAPRACCMADGCQNLLEGDCEAAGGIPQGCGTRCTMVQCP
jgi:hypothetical protein